MSNGPASKGAKGKTGKKHTIVARPKVKLVELLQVITHKGTEHAQPAAGAEEDVRQYINLDEQADPDNPHPEYGRCIQLKARVELVSGDRSGSLAGKAVYWYSKADPNNKTGLSGNQREGFDAEGSGTEKKSTQTDAQGWTPVVKFHLSQYGGDKFEVYVTEDSNYQGGLKAGPYAVWRKLYYDIVEMKTKGGTGKYALPNGVLTKVKSGFEKVLIELQDTGKRHLGIYKDNFDTVEKGFQWADGYCAADGVPQKTHFCVIDYASPRSGTYGATTETAQEEADTTPFTSSGKISAYDFTGHNWLVKAQYWKGEWKNFGPGKVTLVGTRGRRKFRVDFSGSEVTPSATNKVKVRIQYLQYGLYGGWGGSNCLHLLICRGAYEDVMTSAQADKQIIVACLHEIGHAMGLVPTSKAWHDMAHPHHCEYNSCTMWWQSSPGNEAFHDEATSDPGCRTFVRETELTKNVLQSRWKFPR